MLAFKRHQKLFKATYPHVPESITLLKDFLFVCKDVKRNQNLLEEITMRSSTNTHRE